MSALVGYANEVCAKQAGIYNPDATVGERIDQKILHFQERIAALQAVKAKLAEPGGILNCRPDDLRLALD